jgi:hypothetical protein
MHRFPLIISLASPLSSPAACSVHAAFRRRVLLGDGYRFDLALVANPCEKKDVGVLRWRRCAVRAGGLRGRSKRYQIAHGYAPKRLRAEGALHNPITLGEG